mmetsp:Transcript_25050/g.18889  ORF Transcript_25050/g.18889 Transcript_25050/m.18889 type:complete len:193 (+) Transcript_25050:190-768(+)|eukprot:CAMPEP_0202964166 /NCGR_PEP_ID=MMETSP1396-20130829/8242_1 /ASSEMBLY_ACC=CAM_ASM_000872 /TAXON_ID= /ORGANISM="Pseudokeronopsis sp., Strain Brazil" /LENGTH=192 /DNA_ID=CAMNT_0049686049 /DNA_START=317 /DNA_END=895 /DNA_ORIENTATION=-
MQFLAICIFITALLCCYWTNITADENKYHFKLFYMYTEGSSEVVWIYDVSMSCGETKSDSNFSYPEEICQRAAALFVSGFFASIGLTVGLFMNMYVVLSLVLFSMKFTLDKFQSLCVQNLHIVYTCSVCFYVVFSTNFLLYFYQAGWAVLIAIIALALSISSYYHNKKVLKKVHHLENVKMYFEEEIKIASK